MIFLSLTNGYAQRYGFVNEAGQYVIQPNFVEAKNFSEGFAAVEFSSGNFGVINKKGKFVIAKSFMDFMGVMTEGIISYRKKGKYGFYTSDGNEVAKNIYDDVREFKNGFARVKMDGKWGYINKEGKLIISCKYDLCENFENDFAVVSKNSKFFKIDSKGNEAISLPKQIDQGGLIYEAFSFVTPFAFSEGLACIREDQYHKFLNNNMLRN